LKEIARTNAFKVPDGPSKDQQKKIDSLHKVSGDTFNQRYVEFFGVPAHEKAVNLFQREAKSGSNPALREFAQNTLPTLREHLQMARDLSAEMSASEHNPQTAQNR
jgi:putative membrane protein